MNPGTLIYLPDAPSTRKGAKPKQRTGVVVASTWNLPGYVLIEKCVVTPKIRTALREYKLKSIRGEEHGKQAKKLQQRV